MPYQQPPLLIGVSARIYYPTTPILSLGGVWSHTLHYLEQSVAQWILQGDALALMIPSVEAKSTVIHEELNLDAYAQALDGLVLQGGNDIAPSTYGQKALKPEWEGDAVRDKYEIALIRAFVRAEKPIFGICRGLQMLNVAFGGTLWQDIETQVPDAMRHVDTSLNERNVHEVEIMPGTYLSELHGQTRTGWVNSIHHQAIRDLAPGFSVEARSPRDGVIEAIRSQRHPYITAVQWHPEFRHGTADTQLLDSPLLLDFLEFARARKMANSPGSF